jgi:hypothetical protein
MLKNHYYYHFFCNHCLYCNCDDLPGAYIVYTQFNVWKMILRVYQSMV